MTKSEIANKINTDYKLIGVNKKHQSLNLRLAVEPLFKTNNFLTFLSIGVTMCNYCMSSGYDVNRKLFLQKQSHEEWVRERWMTLPPPYVHVSVYCRHHWTGVYEERSKETAGGMGCECSWRV